MREKARTIVEPVIGKDLRLGKPHMPVEWEKRSEQLDGRVREAESVADYERRVLWQIEGLDRGSEEEPKL